MKKFKQINEIHIDNRCFIYTNLCGDFSISVLSIPVRVTQGINSDNQLIYNSTIINDNSFVRIVSKIEDGTIFAFSSDNSIYVYDSTFITKEKDCLGIIDHSSDENFINGQNNGNKIYSYNMENLTPVIFPGKVIHINKTYVVIDGNLYKHYQEDEKLMLKLMTDKIEKQIFVNEDVVVNNSVVYINDVICHVPEINASNIKKIIKICEPLIVILSHTNIMYIVDINLATIIHKITDVSEMIPTRLYLNTLIYILIKNELYKFNIQHPKLIKIKLDYKIFNIYEAFYRSDELFSFKLLIEDMNGIMRIHTTFMLRAEENFTIINNKRKRKMPDAYLSDVRFISNNLEDHRYQFL